MNKYIMLVIGLFISFPLLSMQPDEQKINQVKAALRAAIMADDADTVSELEKNNKNIINNAILTGSLWNAARCGKYNVFRRLLHDYPAIKVISYINGNTLLHPAALGNNKDVIEFLLQTYPQFKEKKNFEGLTPLQYLIKRKKEEVLTGKLKLADLLKGIEWPEEVPISLKYLLHEPSNKIVLPQKVNGRMTNGMVALPVDLQFAEGLLALHPEDEMKYKIYAALDELEDQYRAENMHVSIPHFRDKLDKFIATRQQELQNVFSELAPPAPHPQLLLPELIGLVALYLAGSKR